MKKIAILILTVFSCFTITGQNKIESTGNVGIGTLMPSEKLEVAGNVKISGDIFLNDTSLNRKFLSRTADENVLGKWTFSGDNDNVVDIDKDANSYIRLRVRNTLNGIWSGAGCLFYNNEGNHGQFLFGSSKNTEAPSQFLIRGNGTGGIRFDLGGNIGNFIFSKSNQNNLLIISNSGSVGIGVESPEYKLDVAGTIRATEIKVEAQTADYVFEDNYPIHTLDEVEAYIQKNKCLPDIPNAASMEKNGVNLAEMNKLLLQKIEELTLYVIQQNKALQDKEERLHKLEQKHNENKQ
jgi:hypothetical protein